MAQPLISVLAHASANLRQPAISSLLAQSSPNWELLVASDTQKPSLPNWRRWAEMDQRIRLVPVTRDKSKGVMDDDSGARDASQRAVPLRERVDDPFYGEWRPENIGPRFADFFANISPQPAAPIVPR